MISLPGWGYKPGARRALLIGAAQAALYHWRANAAVLHDVFVAGEEGRQRFRHYLSQHPDIPFYLLLDLADEEFRQDTVARVSRRDRQALLKRKAGRLFKDTSYYCHRITGRERTGRRDDRVLLGALANPGPLRQWVALLDEAEAPLAAICSLPLFTQELLNEVAGQADGRRLLVSLHRVSGLRQTCFDNGEFQFSRLALLPGEGHESYPALLRAEVDKVRRYLNSRQTDTSGEPLHVHFLLAGSVLRELEATLTEQEAVRYHFFDLHGLAPEDAAAEPAQTPFSDGYFTQQLLRLRPGNDYADAAARRWFFLHRLRAGVVAAGCAVLSGSVCWSALTSYNGLVLQHKADVARAETGRYEADYEQARKRLPQTPVGALDLKTAVMTADRLAQHRSTPLDMVSVLSHSLDRFPSIRLSKLSWVAADHAGMAEHGKPGDTGAAAVAGVSDPAATVYQAARLHARIEPYHGNLREAMARVNQFAADLRAQARVRAVSILALPLDVSSGAALQGNTQAERHEAEFSLEVVLENTHET